MNERRVLISPKRKQNGGGGVENLLHSENLHVYFPTVCKKENFD